MASCDIDSGGGTSRRKGGSGAGQWVLASAGWSGATKQRESTAEVEQNRGSRRKEEEGREKTGAPTGGTRLSVGGPAGLSAGSGPREGKGSGPRVDGSRPEGEERSRPGWAKSWVCFPISFPFLFLVFETQIYLNSIGF
jgi:hypothetical protein